VSAVEEYREECAVLRRHDLPPAWMTIQMADAAIAELAAQVDHVNDLLAQAVEVNKHIGEDWVRDKEMLALREAELAALRNTHCRDCCCAQSWLALGVYKYDGKSIPEHITALRDELAALRTDCFGPDVRRCETCRYAVGKTRWETDVTFEKDGYAICAKVAFNDSEFWDIESLPEHLVAWVVDGSDYWAALHVTRNFACSEWAAREDGES
jgi:hypothetical protein